VVGDGGKEGGKEGQQGQVHFGSLLPYHLEVGLLLLVLKAGLLDQPVQLWPSTCHFALQQQHSLVSSTTVLP
jgi:hypothetical protein